MWKHFTWLPLPDEPHPPIDAVSSCGSAVEKSGWISENFSSVILTQPLRCLTSKNLAHSRLVLISGPKTRGRIAQNRAVKELKPALSGARRVSSGTASAVIAFPSDNRRD